MYYECRHIMHNGARCHSPALRDKDYCYYHLRLHQLRKPAKPVGKKEPLDLPHIEDRTSVLDAISKIINALSTENLELKRANSLLYALQIAAQNVERRQDLFPFQGVKNMSCTRGGDELAPTLKVCETTEDCVACDQRDDCPDFNWDSTLDEP